MFKNNNIYDWMIFNLALLLILGIIAGVVFALNATNNGFRGGLSQMCNRDATCDFDNLVCDTNANRCRVKEIAQ